MAGFIAGEAHAREQRIQRRLVGAGRNRADHFAAAIVVGLAVVADDRDVELLRGLPIEDAAHAPTVVTVDLGLGRQVVDVAIVLGLERREAGADRVRQRNVDRALQARVVIFEH